MTKTINQQIADAEARLARLREKSRKKETRHKIIVGALVLTEAAKDAKIAAWLLKQIDAKVTRDVDKTDIAPVVDDLRKVAASQNYQAASVEAAHE
jgi:hypothetical protein